MPKVNHKELLDAGVHFGHLTRKWNPKMAPYIFMERNGIHIIDLHKTSAKLEKACSALSQIAQSGKKILFVGTKKQAQDIVDKKIKAIGMPYVTERWAGGTLTNFATIRKAIRKMTSIDSMMDDGRYDTLSKRERLQVRRQRDKLETQLGSISDLTRLPAALFIIDIKKEHIAVNEAKKLNIPTFAMVDTNSDPTKVDFPIPANDDASDSIEKILDVVAGAIEEGLEERKKGKEKAKAEKEAKKKKKEEKEKAKAEKKEDKKEDKKEEKEKKAGKKVASSKSDKEEKKEGKEVKTEAKKTTSSSEKKTSSTKKKTSSKKEDEKSSEKKEEKESKA